MARLAFTRAGTGAPLVLLHGLGLTRRSWDPVIPMLAGHFDVIAVDLPGFGGSEPLPAQAEATPAALAAAVAGLLDELGITAPHLAGNSLGGWVALELAASRPVASLTLLSPAGLWRGDTPRYCRVSLLASRWLARRAAGPLSRLVRYRLGRVIALRQTHGRPGQLTPGYARAAIQAMGTSPGFDAAFQATVHRRILATAPIGAPVTVAFGSRDLLLLRHQSRHLDQLPPGTQVETLPGCGHVPMADDPGAVAALIIKSAAGWPAVKPALAERLAGRRVSLTPVTRRARAAGRGRQARAADGIPGSTGKPAGRATAARPGRRPVPVRWRGRRTAPRAWGAGQGPNGRAGCPGAPDCPAGRERSRAACGPRWSPASAVASALSWRAGSWRAGSGTGSSRSRRPQPGAGGPT